jgi:DNA polymerase III alpha subunit (gram-positive type)
VVMLKSALRKIYGYALVNRHIIPESQMTTIVVKISPLALCMTYHRISNMINTARAPEFTHEFVFYVVRIAQAKTFCVAFRGPLLVFLSFSSDHCYVSHTLIYDL